MRGPKLQFDSIQTGKLDLWVKFEFSLTNTFYPFSFGRTKYRGINSVESKVELIMNLKFVSSEVRRLTWALDWIRFCATSVAKKSRNKLQGRLLRITTHYIGISLHGL